MATAYTLEQAVRDAIRKTEDGEWTEQRAIFHMLTVLLQHEADKAAVEAIEMSKRIGPTRQ